MKNILFLGSLLLAFNTFSQNHYTGYAQDNFGGYVSSYMQPASIANTTEKFSATFSMAFLNASNFTGDNSSTLSQVFGNQRRKYRDPLFNGYRMQNLSIDVLSAYFEINHENSIGYSFRVRQFGNLDGLPDDWNFAAFNRFDSTKVLNKPISYEHYNFNQFIVNEHRFNYARVIQNDRENFIKVGGAVKLLNGIDAVYLYSENGTFEFIDSISPAAEFTTTDFKYGRAEKDNQFSSRKLGIGLDIGVVYEYRPDYDKFKYDMDGETNIERYDQKKYLFKFGASITDIGRVKFSKDTNSYNFTTNGTIINMDQLSTLGTGLTSSGNPSLFKSFDNLAIQNTKSADQEETFKMNLPTSLNLQADYRFWKDFYIGYTSQIPLKLKSDPHKSHWKAIHTFSPRYETRKVTAVLPISFQRTGQITIGAAGRYTIPKVGLGAFMGGNNIMGLFGKRAKFNSNFFMGVSYSVPYIVPSDIDGDKISDEKDACKYDPGPLRFNGCPDTDGDGIEDKKDYCIYSPGPASTNGCPDTDGDGVIDLDDQCPEEKGLAIHYGCPDTDRDGIIDIADRCPDVPGIELNNGCPFENPGCCMDNDGDGVSNNVDQCPDVSGSVYNNGCPIDSSNIFNINLQEQKEEKDPNHTATKIEEIQESNPKEVVQDGTQIEKTRIENRVKTINIYFDVDDATVEEQYDKEIRELAKDYEFVEGGKYKLLIIGHTDNDGSDNYNLILSKKRAETVRRKFENAGVDYDLIEVFYYGEWRPMKSNDNMQNKRFNRRVEVVVQEVK